MDIRQLMKRKSTSDSRSVENISDKRLRIEARPAQTNGVERVKRFVNFHLHRHPSEKDKQNFDVPPPGKVSADAHACTDFDLILVS